MWGLHFVREKIHEISSFFLFPLFSTFSPKKKKKSLAYKKKLINKKKKKKFLFDIKGLFDKKNSNNVV